MAAAEFSQVQSKLSRYVGSKAKGAMGAKAIMSLKNPNLAEPIEPIRVMKKVISDGVETKEVSNVPHPVTQVESSTKPIMLNDTTTSPFGVDDVIPWAFWL